MLSSNPFLTACSELTDGLQLAGGLGRCELTFALDGTVSARLNLSPAARPDGTAGRAEIELSVNGGALADLQVARECDTAADWIPADLHADVTVTYHAPGGDHSDLAADRIAELLLADACGYDDLAHVVCQHIRARAGRAQQIRDAAAQHGIDLPDAPDERLEVVLEFQISLADVFTADWQARGCRLRDDLLALDSVLA